MKQIKFRAWDSNHKKIREVRELLFDNHGGIDVFCSCDDINARPSGINTLMQSTGLLDKNGKEIYEGDIFDCPYADETKNHHKWQIIWGEISGGFVLQRIGEPCNQRQVHQTVSDMTYREVIGNIYENPELFKQP